LRSYATFLQDISNDTLRSNELFQKAEMLSNMQEDKADADQQASRSSGGPTQNQRAHWTTHVMSKDISIMTNVSSYMTWTLLLLLFVCATVFFILDFYFIKSAESLVGNIFELNIARSETMRSMYFMRSAYLYGIDGDLNAVRQSQSDLLTSSSIVSKYISNQPFTADVADFIYFTKQLYYENLGVTISQRSLQCGQIVFLFCDAATKVAQESPLNFNLLSSLDANDYLRRNLVFGALNFFDPVVQIFESTSLLLEGQVTQFVFLSIVFFVVASIVCVMLGLHMIVLARRLLSDAGVLMRSSTICIVAALNINTSTRKFISKYYTDLDQNFQASLGEDASTFRPVENRPPAYPNKDAPTIEPSPEPTIDGALSESGSSIPSYRASSPDPPVDQTVDKGLISQFTQQNVNASIESSTNPLSMMDTFLESSLSNVETSLLETAIKSDTHAQVLLPSIPNATLPTVRRSSPTLQINDAQPVQFKSPSSSSPHQGHAPLDASPGLPDSGALAMENDFVPRVDAWALVTAQSDFQHPSHAAAHNSHEDELVISPKMEPVKEQTFRRAPSKPQTAPPQNSGPQTGRVSIEKILRSSNKIAPLPSPAPLKPVVHAGNGAIAINQLRKSKNQFSEEPRANADDTTSGTKAIVSEVTHKTHDDIVLELGASGISIDAVDIAPDGSKSLDSSHVRHHQGSSNEHIEPNSDSKNAKAARVSFIEDGSSADGQSDRHDVRRSGPDKIPAAAGGSNSSVSSIEGSERRSKKMRVLVMLALFIVGIVALNLIILNYIQPVAIGSPQYIRIIDMLDLIADLLPPGGYIIEPLMNSLLLVGMSSSSTSVNLDPFKTRYAASRSQFFITNLNWLSSVDTEELRASFSDQNVNAKEFFSYIDRDVIAQLDDPSLSRDGLYSKAYESFNSHREAVNIAVGLANDRFTSLSVSGSSLVLSTVNICIIVSVGIFALCGIIICVETFRVHFVFMVKSIWHRIVPDEQFEAIKDQFAVGGFEWDLNHPRNFRTCIISCVCAFVALIMINMGILGVQANLVLVASEPYKELETSKLLIADILPPPMYLIEMYSCLVIGLEMTTRSGSSYFDITNDVDSWMPRVETLISEYKARETFWSSRFSDVCPLYVFPLFYLFFSLSFSHFIRRSSCPML
jgi:hypothetical protein